MNKPKIINPFCACGCMQRATHMGYTESCLHKKFREDNAKEYKDAKAQRLARKQKRKTR